MHIAAERNHSSGRTKSVSRGDIRGLFLAAVTVVLIAGCKTPPDPDPVEAPVDPGWEVRVVDNSIDVELPEPFVKLVDLARLRIGMTKEEVLAVFPDPYEIELRGADELWQYGFAQLIFRGNRLRDWFDL